MRLMIPVALRPEPPGFDRDVRKKGHEWLQKNGIELSSAPPEPSRLPTYWQGYAEQLWNAYSGVCAYLSIYMEFDLGSVTTDHFVPKSKNAGGAYEWSNFRLACLGMNRRKGVADDVLDPVGLARHTFIINFATGLIKPNPALPPEDKTSAASTIARLKLDNPRNNEMRARHFSNYQKGEWSLERLRKESPFVYEEIMRQGLERAALSPKEHTKS